MMASATVTTEVRADETDREKYGMVYDLHPTRNQVEVVKETTR